MLRSLLGRSWRSSPFKRFDSFEDASAGANGYQDQRIVDTVARKTLAYRDALKGDRRVTSVETAYMLFAVAAAAESGPARIVEFGGACGAAYFEAQAFLPGRVARWEVIETTSMARVGTERFAGEGLSFVDSIGDVTREVDLLVALGSLQYTDDPVRVARTLLDLKPQRALIARLPLARDRTVFVRQEARIEDHGPGPGGLSSDKSSTPATFAARSAVIGGLAPDYIVDVWFPTSEPYPLPGCDVREHAFVASLR